MHARYLQKCRLCESVCVMYSAGVLAKKETLSTTDSRGRHPRGEGGKKEGDRGRGGKTAIFPGTGRVRSVNADTQASVSPVQRRESSPPSRSHS